MPAAVVALSDARLAMLARTYAKALATRRRHLAIAAGILLACVLVAAWEAEIDIAKFLGGIGNFGDYFNRLLTLDSGDRVWSDLGDWFWGIHRWLRLLWDTLLIAYLGSLVGTAGALVGCFLSSRNLVKSHSVRFVARHLLEFCRTVPDIVFALIFVASFGLGPVAGMLAIALHTTGALGKLFSEVVENISMMPIDGVAASGGSWLARVRFGALPQVLSNFASYALLRLEINVRGATIIGIVGAGGIGQDLIVAIRQFHTSDVSAILLLIVACVMLLDFMSETIRHRLISLRVVA